MFDEDKFFTATNLEFIQEALARYQNDKEQNINEIIKEETNNTSDDYSFSNLLYANPFLQEQQEEEDEYQPNN